MDTTEITKAIAAHGQWKERLRQANQSGLSGYTPEGVEPDNRCDFGKWLYALGKEDQNTVQWKKIQTLHAEFHKETARILRLALTGKQTEGTQAMAVGSQYANLSAPLVNELVEWRETIEDK